MKAAPPRPAVPRPSRLALGGVAAVLVAVTAAACSTSSGSDGSSDAKSAGSTAGSAGGRPSRSWRRRTSGAASPANSAAAM